MDQKYILTHNLGTTGNKAVLYDKTGKKIKSWLSLYNTFYSTGNQVEQNPHDWWAAVCESTKNVLRGINEKSVSVVSFSGQMMGCLCLDKAGDPIRNAMIWADMRASQESRNLHDVIDEKQFYSITGHRISSAYTLSKLLWIKNNLPDEYQRISKILLAKDYMVYRLTGRIVTDYSDASGTNMMDLRKREWSRTILSITGIDASILPEIIESTDIAGTVSLEAAADTGLLPGIPVVIGAGDGLCSTIAGVCTEPDDAYLYFGSSAWIGLSRKTPYWDPELRTFNWAHVIPGLVSPCGTMQAAGASIDWAREELGRSETEQAEIQDCHAQDLINNQINSSPPGANGLLFLPYLLGERSPYWDPSAKGALIGLQKKHSRADVFRACMEGVVLNLKIIWNALGSEINAKELVLLGGQTSSETSRQIISDILNIPVVTHNHQRDSKNFGAAMIGGMGIGIFDDLSDIKQMVHFEHRLEPNQKNAEFYDRMLPVFEDSYAAISDINSRMDSLC